jgi:hypothetical protein
MIDDRSVRERQGTSRKSKLVKYYVKVTESKCEGVILFITIRYQVEL